MTERSRTLLPAAVTALVVVVVCQPGPLRALVGGLDHPTLALVATFCASWGLIALLRARLGARLPEGVPLLLCTLPLVTSVVLVETLELPAWLRELSLGAHYDRRAELGLWATSYQLGALCSLALVISEVVTWSRFASSSGRPWLSRALVLVMPFQLPWLVRTAVRWPEPDPYAPQDWLGLLEQPAEILLAATACVVVPLSLQRGERRTLQILGGLWLANVLVFALTETELARLALGYHGCSPATDVDHLEWHVRWLFGSPLLEGVFWVPGLVAFGIGAVVLKQRVPVFLAVISVGVLALHAHAVIRLQRLDDTLSPTATKHFIPRGIGRPFVVMQISEVAVVDAYGKELLLKPFDDLEALGMVLRERSDPPSRLSEPRLTRLALDARLTVEQELEIGRAAQQNGIDALEVWEGEERAAPRSGLLLSTHLRRLLAGQRSVLFFLEFAPPEAQVSQVARTLNLRDLPRARQVVLDLDGQ